MIKKFLTVFMPIFFFMNVLSASNHKQTFCMGQMSQDTPKSECLTTSRIKELMQLSKEKQPIYCLYISNTNERKKRKESKQWSKLLNTVKKTSFDSSLILLQFDSENELSALPEFVFRFSNLESLSYSTSDTLFDKRISTLKKLKMLNVRGSVKSLPRNICEMTELSDVNFYARKMSFYNIDGCIWQMEKLNKLHLFLSSSNDSLVSFPYKLFKPNGIRELFIAGGGIHEFSPQLQYLVSLERFEVFGNPIKEIPDYMGKMKQLKSLIVLSCSLETINSGAFNGLDSLETLDLAYNHLTKLSPDVIELKSLKNLGLTHNYLEEFPVDILKIKTLAVVSLGFNQIKEIPLDIIELDNLKLLDIKYNQIKKLPSDLFELNQLESLFLSGNEELRLDINDISRMKSLKYMLISDYMLTKDEIDKLAVIRPDLIIKIALTEFDD